MYFKNAKVYIFILSLLPIFVFSGVTQDMVSQSEYGEKIFKKKLRRVCNFTSARFSKTHTIDEWRELKQLSKFRTEIHKICPKSIHILEKEWIDPLYALAVIYAKDSGEYQE